MAKRKRLTPPMQPPTPAPGPADPPAPRARAGIAPVAQIAGDAAQSGALQQMADYIAKARADGLLLTSLPLDKIDLTHLHRDRLLPGDLAMDEDMVALIASLRARGQQVPVDVVRLGGDPRTRYGLISGLRRMTALRHLFRETGEARFGTVVARVVAPQDSPQAYLSMVEENEIRAGISFYERARIALKAVEAGAFEDVRAALRGLYGNVSRAKRSKIGSFVTVVAALDGNLRFPAALSERRGLALAKALSSDPDLAPRLRQTLSGAHPQTPEAEQDILERSPAGAAPTGPKTDRTGAGPARATRATVTRDGAHLVVSGPDVDETLERDLAAWLKRRKMP